MLWHHVETPLSNALILEAITVLPSRIGFCSLSAIRLTCHIPPLKHCFNLSSYIENIAMPFLWWFTKCSYCTSAETHFVFLQHFLAFTFNISWQRIKVRSNMNIPELNWNRLRWTTYHIGKCIVRLFYETGHHDAPPSQSPPYDL